MGYNNNHSGIYPVPPNYKWKTDIIPPLDKYAVILAESYQKEKQGGISNDNEDRIRMEFQSSESNSIAKPNDDEIITWAKGLENIKFWKSYREEEYCFCGNNKRLRYKKELDVRIRQGNMGFSIKVPGRYCPKCKKQFIVEKDFVLAVREACGW